MKPPVKPVKGIDAVPPPQADAFEHMERQCVSLFESSGYRQMRLPVLEHTDLFMRSIGEYTDVVQKEMFTFEDRRGASLSLRPEGTAGCVRAAIAHGLLGSPRRLWYSGPFFRRERPQKGRRRQFHQFGAEAFGMAGAAIEAEMIALTAALWERLGAGGLTLKLNTLGHPDTQRLYCKELVAWLRPRSGDLDEDSLRRLDSNPLRILDSKDRNTVKLLADAPKITDFLDRESKRDFDQLKRLLEAAGVAFECDPFLVRGLDYYTGAVFEWVADDGGAQATVCAGGRYDRLVENLGGHSTPAAGFALGIERVLQLPGVAKPGERGADVYFVAAEDAAAACHRAASRIRRRLPAVGVVVDCAGGSFKAQMRRADKSGARLALILGEDEIKRGCVSVKDLRGDNKQADVPQDGLLSYLKDFFHADWQTDKLN